MDIAGKVFIVTGGASGLGEGTARMLAQEGGRVVIADLQAERGQALADELGGAFVRCDVSSEADGQAAVARALQLGTLAGLVNCAGVAPAAKTVGKDGAHPLELYVRTITVNLVGSFNMIRLAAEAMCRNAPEPTGERGVLISTASAASRIMVKVPTRLTVTVRTYSSSGWAPSLPTVLAAGATPAQLTSPARGPSCNARATAACPSVSLATSQCTKAPPSSSASACPRRARPTGSIASVSSVCGPRGVGHGEDDDGAACLFVVSV